MSLLSRPSRTITAGAALVFGSPIDITDALIASNGGPVFDGLVIENTSYSANNGAAIYVLNAKADFVTGHARVGDDSLFVANGDDFLRALPDDPLCNPKVDVPLVTCATVPEPVWLFLS